MMFTWSIGLFNKTVAFHTVDRWHKGWPVIGIVKIDIPAIVPLWSVVIMSTQLPFAGSLGTLPEVNKRTVDVEGNFVS